MFLVEITLTTTASIRREITAFLHLKKNPL